jgi:hypothetical protein
MRDTIDMAREVKATAYTNRHYPDRTTYTFGPEQLKAFEALVRADAIANAVADEREACARVCDALHHEVDAYGAQCAAAIRARGNT